MKRFLTTALTTCLLMLMIASAQAVVLKQGTNIPVKLAQNINANMSSAGETVHFMVTEDILVNGVTVIKTGEFVKGKVFQAETRKSMGKGGKLTLMPKSLTTSNGQFVKFDNDPLSSEGRKRTGATVAHVVMWGPLGLLAKGRAAFMMRDTEFDLTVDTDIDLMPYKVQANDDAQSRENVEASFKKYGKKINYRKGKIAKDFVLHVPMNQFNGASLGLKDFTIELVNGEKLPKPFRAKGVQLNSSKGRYEVSFDFKQMVNYIYPGTVELTVNIGDTYSAETNLETKWKLK